MLSCPKTASSLSLNAKPEINGCSWQEWYTSGGDKATFSSVSSAGGSGGGGGTAARKYISDIEKEGLGTTPDKASYFELKCSIVMATAAQPSEANEKKRAWCYAANPENKKKVVEEGNGWRDESTNPATYLEKCQRRYLVACFAGIRLPSHGSHGSHSCLLSLYRSLV